MNSEIIRDTLTMTSLGIFLFVVGVKVDLSMTRNSGKKSAIIGIVGTIIPLLLVLLLGQLWEPKSIKSFQPSFKIGTTWCVTSYINLSIFLNEYNLLNSKLGRLALSSSIVAELVLSVTSSIIASFESGKMATSVLMASAPFLSVVAFVAFVMFVARPMTMRMVKKTPRGQQLSETHFTMILALALSCGLFAILIGHRIYVGMFVLGLVLPAGPPVGTTLVNRLELYIGGLFVPLFMNAIGMTAMPFNKKDTNEGLYILFIILLNILGKMIGVIGAALFYKFTFFDALILALMMCTKGIYEMQKLSEWKYNSDFNFAAYNVILIAIAIIVGVTSALVKVMYKPSSRHVTYRKRTIQHLKPGAVLRILACIHKQEDVPPIINLLNASHPTRESPLSVCALHLMELVGSTTSMLLPYRRIKESSNPSESDHIFNAFRLFEHQTLGCLQVEPLMSVCPYVSIHDDICSLALDTKASFLILPFHRTMTLDGTLEPLSLTFQNINLNVMDYAPCSIGILVIHGSTFTYEMYHNIVVYFLGGPDDREVLCLALRMATNPKVNLTFVRFRLPEEWTDSRREELMDDEFVAVFKLENAQNKRVVYCEEVVNDVDEMVNVLRSKNKDHFGLVIVGRRKGLDSPLTEGLSMWSEYPELGVIGDMLASADFGTNACTLVVQQHIRRGKL